VDLLQVLVIEDREVAEVEHKILVVEKPHTKVETVKYNTDS
jgi:hypothetical protein